MEGERWREMYRECLKNHAATMGTYADDGCGEFILDETRPGALLCGACGCHRNFHRKVVLEPLPRSQLSPASRERRQRRPRTRFTPDQKVRMGWFADRMGWRISRNATPVEELAVETFCSEIGVSRQTLVIWMHNHKAAAVAAAAAAAAAPTASGASAPLLALPGADVSADVTGDAATENDSVAME